jgi:ribonuclease E
MNGEAPQARQDRPVEEGREPREPREGGRRDRNGRRNDRRGERTEGQAAEGVPSEDRPFNPEAAPQLSADGQAQTGTTGENGEEQRQPRERRSRDRYGRDRRERGEGGERGEAPADGSTPVANTEAPETMQAAAQEERAPAVAAFVAPATPVIAPVAAPRAPEPVAAAAKTTALPKVQSYDLPLQDLVQVAQTSGLQWVNSDAAKIAEAQAAIAAEPKPVHVPRERAPVVASEEGPLVLVETKRDLGSMKLPFENPAV